ncbi:MAG: hypothetical protein LRY73_19390 [Bacillus sp. (in: Bacteria)]|nr:hypothetical protein [Bacillus sp. (in: firmicutes)]
MLSFLGLLKNFFKGLNREPQAQFKLMHLLLAYHLINKDVEATKANLRMALKYPGFSLYTRIQTSFFSEAINDILEAVYNKDEEQLIDDTDIYELTGSLLYASGFRQIALKF